MVMQSRTHAHSTSAPLRPADLPHTMTSAAPMSSHAQQAAQDNLGASSLQAAPLNVGDCFSSTELLRDAAERVMLSQGRTMVSDQRATGEKMDDAPPIAREDERAESESENSSSASSKEYGTYKAPRLEVEEEHRTQLKMPRVEFWVLLQPLVAAVPYTFRIP